MDSICILSDIHRLLVQILLKDEFWKVGTVDIFAFFFDIKDYLTWLLAELSQFNIKKKWKLTLARLICT